MTNIESEIRTEVFSDVGEHRIHFYLKNHFIVGCEDCGRRNIFPSDEEGAQQAQKWAIGRLLSVSCDRKAYQEKNYQENHDDRVSLENFK